MIAPGVLSLHTRADASGATRITGLRQRYPQRVTTALHSDPAYPHAANLCVQSPSGGTFSDDDLRTTVRCASGTHLHLTSQAATQVFAGGGPGARHRLSFGVESGAVLEYLPKTIIPQADSTFVQQLEVDVAPGGVYIGWDAIAAGRIAHGERFRYAAVDTAFTVRIQGRVVARERQLVTADAAIGADYLATLLIIAPDRCVTAVLSAVRAALARHRDSEGGAGELPSAAGIFARIRAASAPALLAAQQALHTAARTILATAPIVRSTP
ncbi:urease accessory protein UreD [Mycolicibacterium neoaurum]|uniref:urease accessory protein UreD n=1 Tax=Mycolicibacterium neoaurum TaxID=1795 RepID=UPI0026714063|nr:urease accessory protein UreD [Mycolicibacterium neoaurum]MDO3400168.1 urease accessory protein UreD [Mycolicibacterium neoaurum]